MMLFCSKSGLISFMLMPLFWTGFCQTQEDVKTLYNDLFKNYTKGVKPGNPNHKLVVAVQFYLTAINRFREVDETLELTGSFFLRWEDSALAWDASSYNNLQNTTVDSNEIWTPPMFVVNRVDEIESFAAGKTFVATLQNDGTVIHSPGSVFDIKCKTDISKFPYDTQTCVVNLIPWGYTSSSISLSSISGEANLNYYSPNSDWELQQCSASVGTLVHYTKFSAEIVMKRASLYYTVMVVLPTILFAILNPLVFVLPIDAGERIGLAMTILLSYAIFLTLVSASIPASSNPMSVLLIVMVTIISVSGVIAFITIFSVGFYHNENIKDIPTCFQTLGKWNIKRQQNTVVPVEKENEIRVTGKDVAIILDKISLITSYVIILTVILSYFLFVFLK